MVDAYTATTIRDNKLVNGMMSLSRLPREVTNDASSGVTLAPFMTGANGSAMELPSENRRSRKAFSKAQCSSSGDELLPPGMRADETPHASNVNATTLAGHCEPLLKSVCRSPEELEEGEVIFPYPRVPCMPKSGRSVLDSHLRAELNSIKASCPQDALSLSPASPPRRLHRCTGTHPERHVPLVIPLERSDSPCARATPNTCLDPRLHPQPWMFDCDIPSFEDDGHVGAKIVNDVDRLYARPEAVHSAEKEKATASGVLPGNGVVMSLITKEHQAVLRTEDAGIGADSWLEVVNGIVEGSSTIARGRLKGQWIDTTAWISQDYGASTSSVVEKQGDKAATMKKVTEDAGGPSETMHNECISSSARVKHRLEKREATCVEVSTDSEAEATNWVGNQLEVGVAFKKGTVAGDADGALDGIFVNKLLRSADGAEKETVTLLGKAAINSVADSDVKKRYERAVITGSTERDDKEPVESMGGAVIDPSLTIANGVEGHGQAYVGMPAGIAGEKKEKKKAVTAQQGKHVKTDTSVMKQNNHGTAKSTKDFGHHLAEKEKPPVVSQVAQTINEEVQRTEKATRTKRDASHNGIIPRQLRAHHHQVELDGQGASEKSGTQVSARWRVNTAHVTLKRCCVCLSIGLP